MTRHRALLVLLFLSGFALVLRLLQVQLHEHELWAREASRLVKSGKELPYRRGRIVDASGTVLARDESLRSVVLVYRKFRRGHPLGQVAHARSLLEGRPVALADARARLAPWALALVALSPRDVRALARGEATDFGAGFASCFVDERLRGRRAADLLFYLRGLLCVDERTEWRELLPLARAEGTDALSFLELVARVRHGDDPRGVERERAALEARLAHAMERLAVLAGWLVEPGSGAEPLTRLVEELEGVRRAVEDAAGARLFQEAAGFAPGRIAAETLRTRLDNRWLAELSGWDDARVAEWCTHVRASWESGWRAGECLPQVLWSLVLDPTTELGPEDFLDALAVAYQPEETFARALDEGPRSWREVHELAVFEDLPRILAARPSEEALAFAREALPILVEEARDDPDLSALFPRGGATGAFLATLESALAGRRSVDVEALLELGEELFGLWDFVYQDALERTLDAIRAEAGPDELGPSGGLLLSDEARERAAERAEYWFKDFGSRPRPLGSRELSYDVVYLLTRWELDFPGFEVREYSAREALAAAADDARPAEPLVGRVQAPTRDDEARERRARARKRELLAEHERSPAEEAELERLIGEGRLLDQARGVSGVEAFFERELAGRNGFAETRGLDELVGPDGDRLFASEAIDGEDVVLTLEARLVADAQRTLREPERPDDAQRDDAWYDAPVGAIVLLSGAGDVLAAASEPDEGSLIDPEARGERQFRRERTLKKPTFQPPGSVFKPFVAAWALEHGLDAGRTVVCAPLEKGGAGYKDLRCWNTSGHGAMDLHAALEQSCNAYFAWLGETMQTDEFVRLCAEFGFGQPTGVRRLPPWDDGLVRRSGLSEDLAGLALPRNGAELSETLRRRTANGLQTIEATPMQLARAMLALGTGAQRELRLVQRVGAREFPPAEPRPLAVGPTALDFVRRAMMDVAASPLGSAHKALNLEELGVRVAVKTGSADIEGRKVQGDPRVLKHTWVAGWLPAEKPELVFVVFVHRTLATSSHGAIYVARQLLRQPGVRAWLTERGVELAEVGAR